MGVCGGLGEYLNIDPTIIRLVWFVLGIASFGTFALAYLVCGLVIPENDGFIEADSESSSGNDNGKLFVGLALVVVGALMLGKIVFPWFSYTLGRIVEFWPALLIILGLYIILGRKNN